MGHFYYFPSHKAQDHHGRESGKTGRARGCGGLKRMFLYMSRTVCTHEHTVAIDTRMIFSQDHINQPSSSPV